MILKLQQSERDKNCTELRDKNRLCTLKMLQGILVETQEERLSMFFFFSVFRERQKFFLPPAVSCSYAKMCRCVLVVNVRSARQLKWKASYRLPLTYNVMLQSL